MTSLLDEPEPQEPQPEPVPVTDLELDLDPDLAPETDPEPEPVPVPEPAAGPGRRRRRPSPSRRIAAGLLAVAAVAGLGVAGWSVPTVRSQLLLSFTQQDQPYAELFFTTMPTFDGATVSVPVSVTDHGEGAKGYQVKVTLESPNGQVLTGGTANLTARYGAPVSTVFKLQAPSEVAMVRVALVGHPQTLHYSFGKLQLPDH
ncbi:hypothetical protein [Kitasatospora sp. MAP5-34]|uniref:hypothetical protein n=1 Tax=Kitasatospora sp. MAP5-34 TaxID=3035102 RepID=UPI00247426CE|nr:hypothetical protein [Kitasatospora sp. MAP5-34]MDH6578058.1 hypothetical protein [Kitasatospora sp. MAP5-34]